MVVSNEYVKVINEKINRELPKELKIIYHHYDVKAKKKEERNFPFGLFALAEQAISKIGIFKVNSVQPRQQQISIQRGVIRTNCIDSLDRTNFAQELIGYVAILEQLVSMRVLKKGEIQMKSEFFNSFFEMYNKMGDSISI